MEVNFNPPLVHHQVTRLVEDYPKRRSAAPAPTVQPAPHAPAAHAPVQQPQPKSSFDAQAAQEENDRRNRDLRGRLQLAEEKIAELVQLTLRLEVRCDSLEAALSAAARDRRLGR